ncbi:MAG TPA: SAM-dependent chlorinase/fluorinase [Solirubrobacteraceae bacterium]|nr:SAM-dependent chlorinase/fluorinase [Solirubrobacteraceae bacterium]
MTLASRPPVITLLTDYGVADEFVGVLHGVIARICPAAHVIDLSHAVPRQDVRAGAALLSRSLPYMPVGLHVAVVDPTVGSDRRAVALRLADGRTLLGPDNGLLWPAAQQAGGVVQAAEISASRWRLEPQAATFHGRDIFAPVAAHLAGGEPLSRAGEPLDPALLVRLEAPPAQTGPGTLIATVVGTDGFGNVQLSAESDQLDAELGDTLQVGADAGVAVSGSYARTFSDVDEGELLVLEDSSRQLALAINRGNAAARLELRTGDRVRITNPRRA